PTPEWDAAVSQATEGSTAWPRPGVRDPRRPDREGALQRGHRSLDGAPLGTRRDPLRHARRSFVLTGSSRARVERSRLGHTSGGRKQHLHTLLRAVEDLDAPAAQRHSFLEETK